jgi:RNA polymerase sigma factor (sigma-70 family)
MSAENVPSRLEAISTRWSLLCAAHEASETSAGAARNALVLRYLPAVRRYVAAILPGSQDADDVAQDIMMRLLAGDFAGADPQRGRFRDLLKVAIRNMVRNRWKRENRRRAVALDVAEIAAEEDGNQECWTAQWRQSVLDLAWKALEQHERTQPGALAYTLLRLRTKYPDDTSEQLAVRLGQKTGQTVRADAVRQKLRRARVQFADLLISEIANGLSNPTADKIEDELADLGLMSLVRTLLPGGSHSR